MGGPEMEVACMVGLENGDAVQAINTLTPMKSSQTIPVGQFAAGTCVCAECDSHRKKATANLKTAWDGDRGASYRVSTRQRPVGFRCGHASVFDQFTWADRPPAEIAATGLEPGKKYRLVLVGGTEPQALVVFTAGIGGTAIAQTLGPLKRVIAPSQTVPGNETRSDDRMRVEMEI